MIFRRAVFVVLVSFILVRSAFAASDAVNVMRVHWLGLKQVGAGTNAASFMKIWQMPQTAALVAQTLDKLSRWPGHGATNAASARLRPLLDDLISSEFYLELSAPTNLQPSTFNPQLFLAVRLPAVRADLWRTNIEAAAAGWQAAGTPHRIECSRVGGWTLLGVGLDQKISQADFAVRLAHDRAPANLWLEADLDSQFLSLVTRHSSFSPAGFFSTFNLQPSTFNHLHLSLSSDSSNLLTRATIDLARPFAEPLPAWEIPTNLIRGPLTSFGVARGFGTRLAAQPFWQKTGLAPAPDQLTYWSRDGIPFQTYVAAPLPGASNQLARLFPKLIQYGNPWLATNAEGSFAWAANMSGILWNDANILTPFLVSSELSHRDYLFGGLYPPATDAPRPPPARVLQAIHDRSNLLFAGLEGTGSRVEDGFFILQNFRVVFHKPQMPHEAAGTQWLKKSEQSFGETFTTLCLANPHQLEFERDSTVGLNALELHLLADWLESPQFPCGLHTFLAPPDKTP